MNQKKTLLEIAGITPPPLKWDNITLIMIDYQKEYSEGRLPLDESGATAVQVAKSVLDQARKHKAPVIHVVHHGSESSPVFNPSSDYATIINDLTPLAGELLIVKSKPDAFEGTDLNAHIKTTGKPQLLVCGFMSHMCVESTVRSALNYGYPCYVCSDACATRDLTDEEGERIPAAQVHRVTMAALRDRFASIIKQNSLINSNITA